MLAFDYVVNYGLKSVAWFAFGCVINCELKPVTWEGSGLLEHSLTSRILNIAH